MWKSGNLCKALHENLYGITVGKNFLNKIKTCIDSIKYVTILKQRLSVMKSDLWSRYQTEQKHLTSLSPYISLKIKRRDFLNSTNMGKIRDTATKFWKLESRWISSNEVFQLTE